MPVSAESADGRISWSGPSSADIGADESDGTMWDVPTPVFHVRTDGADTGVGLAWSSAKRTVQAAINAARAPVGVRGTYPERLLLPAFVYLYGRFRGANLPARSVTGAAPPSWTAAASLVLSANAGYLLCH
jgi:hypothetical protein